VGSQGSFDRMAHEVLRDLRSDYDFEYEILLAYMPKKNSPAFDDEKTLFPSVLEKVHPRFAIDKRNRWMVEQSDFVVTYVRISGGAAKFKELAQKKKKTVIEL